ncbi:MAG: hypothetical protein QHG98_03960 [Methanothrix sp.]|nr:hypothetical protein [Methanothrix sp.]
MAVVVSAGTIRIGPDVLDVSEQTVNISPSDETLYRIDVIYRDTSGNAQVLTGVPAEIINPNQLPSWTGYISPSPPEEIPDGVILGVVFVPAETETIQASYIWEFAAGVEDPVLVGDIVTSVGSPGDNSHVPSEAAVRTLADTKLNLSDIVTTLGNPGSNSKVPSEKAVRDVFNLLGVTNGNNHDHYGGDGAQISHSTLSNLTADDHTQYLNTTRHDTTARHGSSVVDHGSIGGLGDDDHTQYLNTTRHDTTSRHTPGTVVPVVTSVGSPGSDSNIPSEKAVRTAVNDMTNLATQMHALTSKATPVDADETFLIDSAASYGPKRLTWSNIKATLKSYFDSLYAPSSKGVTNGDLHDHAGGDGAQISHSTLSNLTADDHTQYLNTTRHDTTARHGSSVVDHGSIGGLGDDDHTQYLNTTRHDTTSRHTPGTVVPVVTSVGSPGSDSNIPSEKAVRAAINAINVSRAINVQFENGGYVLEANQVIWVQLPNAATTITGLQMVADTTGSVVVNVKYATYSSYPTTYDQCGSAKPTLSSAQKYSTDCSSWTRKTFSAGDWVVFIIESCSTITRLNISLSVV